MVPLNPVPHALLPVDSAAAKKLISPNYDEFQSDLEIYEWLQREPSSVLHVTMPHAFADSPEAILQEGSDAALKTAASQLEHLRNSSLTREQHDVLFLYEIENPEQEDIRQIGLGGMVPAEMILTDKTPDGTIVRNEGVRETKARQRAELIQATRSIIGTVNLVVEDNSNTFTNKLKFCTTQFKCSFEAQDETGLHHRIWLLPDSELRNQLVATLASEPCAYVADGNHRSAAAAMLGLPGFLAVIFPAASMGLSPYNRLISEPLKSIEEWKDCLQSAFQIEQPRSGKDFQPTATHQIGLYADNTWLQLTPLSGSYDSSNAAKSIDSAIVQSQIFDAICGIKDPRDTRLTFVGGNRVAGYLRSKVADGEFAFAVTLPPVTMKEFMDVCRQRRIMPPKSTWFSPKIRSGLVMALLD